MGNGVYLAGNNLERYQGYIASQLRRVGLDEADFEPNTSTANAIVAFGSYKDDSILYELTGERHIERNHAYQLNSELGIPVVPTFHPSLIIEGNAKYTGCFQFCIQKAIEIAKGKLPLATYELLLDPPSDKARVYFDWRNDWLVCDIETYESPDGAEDEAQTFSWKIVRVSFSNRQGTAISFPWQPPYINLAKTILENAPNVVFWNQSFDVPRLEAAGAPVKGRVHDAMWAWHFLQSDLPKKLGFAAPLLVNVQPWKHLSSRMPAHYSALDSAVTMDAWLAIQSQLQAEGRWNAFIEQCTDMLPINANMTREGMLIDVTAKSKLLNTDPDKGPLGTLVQERDTILESITKQIPKSVRSTKAYKKKPPKKLKPGEEYVPNTIGANDGGILYLPFNPSSPVQKVKLFNALGLPIPKDWRTGSHTIESKHLRKHSKKFPVLRDIENYGERQKVITAYDWETDEYDKIHSEFGFNPSTWRKSCRNPNVQTIPKRSELAKLFRRLFIAGEGYLLIECDSSAIEAVLVGYFAGSQEYIALAKRGVHKWLAEKVAGRPVSKEEPLYDRVKRIVHLSNYLGSPSRIAEEYPDDFPSVYEAAKLQNFYFEQPEIKPVRLWQQQTLAIAQHDHYMQTPFGQRHYFYDVLRRDGQKVSLGNDAKRSIAFMPQATASAIQTRYIHSLPWATQRWMRAIIHDSIILRVPESEVQEHASILYKAMTSPLLELGGLTIGAECKIGPSLGDMKVFTP